MKKPGEKGPFGKGLLLPPPVPPPLIPPNVLTGGEAARREFLLGGERGCYTPSFAVGREFLPRGKGEKTTTGYCPSNKEYRHG